MKRWAWLLAVPLLIALVSSMVSAAGAQIASSLNSPDKPPQAGSSRGSWHDFDSDTTDRMFFPRDMFWGWVQLDLAPPHNEIDPCLLYTSPSPRDCS